MTQTIRRRHSVVRSWRNFASQRTQQSVFAHKSTAAVSEGALTVTAARANSQVYIFEKQEALLLQRDRARHLSVEILQLQNISLENPMV